MSFCNDTGKRAYQLQNIERRQLSVKGSSKALASSSSTADIHNVSELRCAVKRIGELSDALNVIDKMLNDDGTPKLMYHGTPYGGYTVFKDWQYFTDDREYANVYQYPSASSIRGRYSDATDPMTYEVYPSVKKPFDTRDPKTRRIWKNEFYDHYSRTPLTDKGLPDWTDGIDLVEFIEDNEYDYDAIILDEGAVGEYGDEVKSRGISVVVRSSNQVKSATDNIGIFDSDNPDIHYQTRDPYAVFDRELLANVLTNALTSETERRILGEYQENLGTIEKTQEELDATRRRIADVKDVLIIWKMKQQCAQYLAIRTKKNRPQFCDASFSK